MKRTMGDMKKARELLEKELPLYAATYCKPAADRNKFDVLAGFAGKANITLECRALGLKVMEPADAANGWYLDTAEVIAAWNKAIQNGRPAGLW